MAPAFSHHQLPNGLNVVAETNDQAHTASIGFFVNTGSRDEDSAVMGVSHFLEHMMFKGTDRRTADDVNRQFDQLGANYNAYTSQENTVYFAQVLPEMIPQTMDLFTDMLRPALREDDFNMEKNVILEEIGMYQDQPQWRLQDTIIEAHFAGHPLGHRVLGTQQTVGDLTVQQMREYFARRYSPDNITVAAAGAIDLDALIADLNRLTSHWEPSGAMRQDVQPSYVPRDITMDPAQISRHYLAILCPGPSAQDDRRFAAKVLADVIGDEEGSRLYWNLIDPGLADEADFTYFPQDRVGSFFGFACCDPDQATQVEKVFLDTLDQFTQQIDDSELQRAKNKLATQATVSAESPMGRMRDIGTQWQYLQSVMPLDEQIERIMQVTRDDLVSLLDQIPFTPRTLVRMSPSR